jgi:hypothetical protein
MAPKSVREQFRVIRSRELSWGCPVSGWSRSSGRQEADLAVGMEFMCRRLAVIVQVMAVLPGEGGMLPGQVMAVLEKEGCSLGR